MGGKGFRFRGLGWGTGTSWCWSWLLLRRWGLFRPGLLLCPRLSLTELTSLFASLGLRLRLRSRRGGVTEAASTPASASLWTLLVGRWTPRTRAGRSGCGGCGVGSTVTSGAERCATGAMSGGGAEGATALGAEVVATRGPWEGLSSG